MATQAQIEANRRNAQRSTGPRTPEGKAVASRNATRLGLYSRDLVLPGEESGELEALREDVYRRFAPRDAAETLYVERFVASSWRLRRALAGEAKLLARWQRSAGFTEGGEVYTDSEAAKELDRLGRHIAGLERSMDRALGELRRLQKAGQHANDQIEPNSPAPEDRSPSLDAGSARVEIVKSNPISPPIPPPRAENDDPQTTFADPRTGSGPDFAPAEARSRID